MYFPDLIGKARLGLNETQKEFGKRFSVSQAAVCLWESGKREAPYVVLECVLEINHMR